MRWAGAFSGAAWGLADGKRRRAVASNIPGAFNPLLPFVHFHWTVLENLKYREMDSAWVASHVRVRGMEHVRKVLDAGGTAIHLTSHIGNWEIGARATALLGIPLTMVVMENTDGGMEDAYRTRRGMPGLEVAYVGRLAARRALRALREGKNLAMVFDFVPNDRGIEIQWFGRAAKVARGPFWLAQKAGVPIIPTFCLRRGVGEFDLVFEEALQPSRADFIQKTVDCMESYQRQYRAQWAQFTPIHGAGAN